jgi:hypothetical protein
MTAALLHACGAWGRVNQDVLHSSFHLSVLDRCVFRPILQKNEAVNEYAKGHWIPKMPCSQLTIDNFEARVLGALRSLGWESGPVVVKSHVALPFVDLILKSFPSVQIVMVFRPPPAIAASTQKTGWYLHAENYEFWSNYARMYSDVQKVLVAAYPDRIQSVHPEYFLRNDAQELGEILERSGLSWTPQATALLDVAREAGGVV